MEAFNQECTEIPMVDIPFPVTAVAYIHIPEVTSPWATKAGLKHQAYRLKAWEYTLVVKITRVGSSLATIKHNCSPPLATSFKVAELVAEFKAAAVVSDA